MKLKLDPNLMIILGSLALGLSLPVSGTSADVLNVIEKVAIFVLFFGYGARLSAAESLAGLKNWKLHVAILGTTFVVYPLMSLPMRWLPEAWVSTPIRMGLIFLCLVPSTVQSSITFTSLARGNIAAAMVSATASNVLGVLFTPLLVMLLIPDAGGGSVGAGQLLNVVLQLLLPFFLGQLSRFATAEFMSKHKARLKYLDQGVICLIVYAAFSDLRVSGVWRQLQIGDLIGVLVIVAVLLTFMFWLTWHLGKWMGMPRGDQIALLFCGTKKSLATGVPMASVLFSGPVVSVLVIPLMLYHQSQLIVSSVLAGRLRETMPEPPSA